MSDRPNLAHEMELARLIAEQAADDTDRVSYAGKLSLDVPIAEGGLTLGEVLSADVAAGERNWFRRHTYRTTADEVRLWRYLRNEKGMTYQQISEEVGRAYSTVRRHLTKTRSRARTALPRMGGPMFNLVKLEEKAWEAYEAGARLQDIADLYWQQTGYASSESCYQSLRVLFRLKRRPLRWRTMTHGMRSRDATPEQIAAYRKMRTRKARERLRENLTMCIAKTRFGVPCKRWAIRDEPYCVAHSSRRRQPKWTAEKICMALQRWTTENGRPPRPRDWHSATEDHPSFKTVYNVYFCWDNALADAGVLHVEQAASVREFQSTWAETEEAEAA